MCGRAVYCVTEQCTVWYGCVLCGRAMYFVAEWCTVW